MEYHNLLNPVNNEHLFALHYVFLPRINKALVAFMATWNNHGVRTEHGKTPNQIFTEGALRLRNSGLVAFDFFESTFDVHDSSSEYSEDENAEAEGITVPATTLNINDEELDELRATVDPLSQSDEYGIDLYQETLQFLRAL